MKIINPILIALILMLADTAFGQANNLDSQNEEKARLRAKEIIDKSKNSMRRQAKVNNITSLIVNYESKLPPTDKLDESVISNELTVVFPDKIHNQGKGITSDTVSIFSTVSNNDKFDSNRSVFLRGQPINVNLNSGSKEDRQREFKWKTWTVIFPLILDSWYYPLDFKFVAIAESKDGKADVLEAASSNNIVYRLFFDQNTHFLLMMTGSFQTKNGDKIEDKYFFSDYKENNGLILPHIIQYRQNNEIIETRNIKSLKINSDIKSDLFEIKE